MSGSERRNQRKREKEAAWAAEQAAREKEERRRAARSTWEKIQESDASSNVKEILHEFAEKLGLE